MGCNTKAYCGLWWGSVVWAGSEAFERERMMAVWAKPKELNQSLPRRCRLTGAGVWALFSLLVFPPVIGAIPFLTVHFEIQKYEILRTRGVKTTGVVDRITTAKGGYRADYHFLVKSSSDGEVYQYADSAGIGRNSDNAIRVGGPVAVIYDGEMAHSPDAREVSSVDMGDSVESGRLEDGLRPVEYMGLGISAVVFLVFLVAIVPALVRERRLLRVGQVAHAKITGEVVRYVAKQGYRLILDYSFVDAGGRTVTGRSRPFPSKKTLDETRKMDFYRSVVVRPTVLFDVGDGSRNILFPPRYWKAIAANE
jgi:hypothetical protein